MEYKYFWIVFVYKCVNNEARILLLDKTGNLAPFLFEDIKPSEFKKAIELFIKTTGIKEKDCFPNRFFEYSHQLSFEQKNQKIIISSTSVRLLDDYHLNPLLEKGEWLSKNEVFEKLKYNKMFLWSFKREFGNDSFWECLKHKKTPRVKIKEKKD